MEQPYPLGRTVAGVFADIDAEFSRRTGLSCRTRRKAGGLFSVAIGGRTWLLFLAPAENYGPLPHCHATAHFRVALRGQQSFCPDEAARLKKYLRLLSRQDARLTAAWPSPTPWSEAPARLPLAEVRRSLERYRPYFAASELPPAARRTSLRQDISHYHLLLHYLLTRHPARGVAGPRLLELGCHYGLFLDLLRRRGYRKASGIDLDAPCVVLAANHGLDARRVDALRLGQRYPPDSFDVACAIQFFVKDLQPPGAGDRQAWILKVFDSVRSCLRPGGAFFCDAEIRLPLAAITALGFQAKYRVLRPKFLSGVRTSTREDVWVFEVSGSVHNDRS